MRLPPGDYTVRIAAQKWVPAPPGSPVGYNGRPMEKIPIDVVPKRYNAESPLRISVTKAELVDFKLAAEEP